MNELTISIKYRPMSKKVARLLCISLGVIELAAIAFFCVHSELSALMKLAYLLVGAAIFTYAPFVVVTFYREGGTLIANSDGLVLPASWWGFGNAVSINWKDVSSIDIHTTDKGQELLLLRTTRGRLIKAPLSSIVREELERLLLAMEIWLPSQSWSDRAIAQRDGLQITGGDGSFTQMWESELRRRYSATTFVPHEPGTMIRPDLKVVRQLAFGGFSAVYLGEDSNREAVVIKELVIPASNPELRSKVIEQFQREATILAKLNHPQIAKVFDHFVKDDNTYMTLENIDGENLRQFVRRKGAQSEEWVLGCAEQMVDILDYLHNMHPPIIHRDFTPDNLVLSSDDRITLIDFGAANEFTTAATGTLVGKQAYMPIEQIRGKAEPRSDLYALGCVLFWLLTGAEPEPLTVCHPRQVNAAVSESMDLLVAKLTGQECADRFASASAVNLRALFPAHFGEPKISNEGSGHGG